MRYIFVILVTFLTTTCLSMSPEATDTAKIEDIEENVSQATQNIELTADFAVLAVQNADDARTCMDAAINNISDAAIDTASIVTDLIKQPSGKNSTSSYRSEQQDASRKERILAHVAKIVSSIFSIVKDPHSAHNVGDSVSHMLGGIINIAVEAIKERQNNKKEAQATHSLKESLL